MKKVLTTLFVLLVAIFYANAQCDTARNLSATMHSPAWYNVNLGWSAPASVQELTWCNGVYSDGIGTGSATDFSVAHRYATTDLTSVNGQTLTAVSFYPLLSTTTYSIRIYTGGSAVNPGTMVLDMELDSDSLTMSAWNTVLLSSPVTIDATQELWIAIRCNATTGYPAAYDGDANAEVPGKGNMMYYNSAWDTLSNLGSGLNGNWLIKGLFDVPAYDVYRNSALIAANLSSTAYSDLVAGAGTYVYDVALNGCTEKISTTVVMTVDPCENPVTTPYITGFDTNDANVGCWTSLDNNADGRTFSVYSAAGYAAYFYSSTNAGNDYLVSPEIILTGDESLSFDYKVASSSHPEKMSVYIWGESDTAVLMPTTTLTNATYQTYTVNLGGRTGNYHIAFKAESDANMYYLYIDNFMVCAACSMAPTDFVVSQVNDANVELAWTSVTNAQYKLEYQLQNDTVWHSVISDYTGSSYIFAGQPSQAYTFRLYQKCASDANYINFATTNALTNPLTGAFIHAVYPDSYLYNFDVNDPANLTPVTKIANVYAGEYYDGNYYYVTSEAKFYKMNMNTLVSTELATWNSILRDIAYDYTTNTMYGINDTLFTINLTTGERTGIDTLTKSLATLACDLQGTLYTVEFTTGDLYSLDKATAAPTLIGATGLATSYIQTMGFDHNSGILYWAHFSADGDFYTLNPVTAVATYIGDFYNSNEMSAFFTPYTYNPNQLNAPALVVTADENLELQATVTVTNPTTNVGGNTISGNMDSIVVTRNDEVIYVETTQVAPGATFTFVDSADLACGQYTYKAFAYTDGDKGLVAMQTVEIGNMCDFIVNMTDAYGDGWNGAKCLVYVDGEYVTSFTMSANATAQTSVRICDGANVELFWEAGSYDEEVAFSVVDAYEQNVYYTCEEGDASNFTTAAFASFTHSCDAPSCFKPTNLQVSNIENTSALVSWTDTINTTWVVEYGVQGFTLGQGTVDTVNATSITLTDLTANTAYDVYVYADCGAEDGISLNVSASFLTDICASDDKCDIIINMTDAYGDGWAESSWYGLTGIGYLEIASDGVVLGQVYLQTGTSGADTLSACVHSTITVTWKVSGTLEYADEIGFTIMQGQGSQVVAVTDGSTLTAGQTVATFEQRCDVGVEDNEMVENQVSIYPNPTRDILNVQAENFRTVEVLNFLGQVVYTANVTSSQFQINTSNLTAGVYFLRLSGDNIVTKKFVKE